MSVITKSKARQRVEVAHNSALSLSNSLCLMTWFSHNQPFYTSPDIDYLAAKGGLEASLTSGDRANYGIVYESSSGVAQLRGGFYDSGGTLRQVTAPLPQPPLDTDVFAALDYDKSTGILSLYWMLAGASALTTGGQTTIGGAPAPANNTRKFVFGGTDEATTPGLGGNFIVHDVRLYSVHRTAAAIYAAATTRPMDPTTETGLVGLWNLDDGLGAAASTTAADASGNGLNGALVNGCRWAQPAMALSYQSYSLPALLISAEDYVEDLRTTITATSQDSVYVATNVRHYLIEQKMLSSGSYTTWYLNLDFARPVPIRFAALYNHNLPSTVTVKLQLSQDNFASIAQAYTIPYHAGTMRMPLRYVEQYRYARFALTSTAAMTSIQIGKARIGPLIEVKAGATHEIAMSRNDTSVIDETNIGVRQVRQRVKRLQAEWLAARIAKYELAKVTKWARAGQAATFADVMLAPSTDLYGKSVYGRLDKPFTLVPISKKLSAYNHDPVLLIGDEAAS